MLPECPVTTVTVFPAAPAGVEPKAGTNAVPNTAARLATPTVQPRRRIRRAGASPARCSPLRRFGSRFPPEDSAA